MSHIIPKICHICLFAAPEYKIFCIENLQICSAYRLLYVGISFENIWCFLKKLERGSSELVLQIDFLSGGRTKRVTVEGFR
jgi:hypothetical protein